MLSKLYIFSGQCSGLISCGELENTHFLIHVLCVHDAPKGSIYESITIIVSCTGLVLKYFFLNILFNQKAYYVTILSNA